MYCLLFIFYMFYHMFYSIQPMKDSSLQNFELTSTDRIIPGLYYVFVAKATVIHTRNINVSEHIVDFFDKRAR